jgi:uncharacterized membrane protein
LLAIGNQRPNFVLKGLPMPTTPQWLTADPLWTRSAQSPWVKCAALGLATGARASAALTALTWSAGRQDPSWLAHPATKALASAMSAGESIGDQLPAAPSRLNPGGLAPRLVLGAGAGALLARRHRGSPWTGAAVALAAAGVGAVAGHRLRAVAADKLGSDHPGAVVEDAIVVGLGAYAGR